MGIHHIISNIKEIAIDEIAISKEFSNSPNENKFSNILNSLIVLLEAIGENGNEILYKIIFENTINNSEIPFECLLSLYKNIFDSLFIDFDKEFIRETNQNNLLIIFFSLTQCINEYLIFINNEKQIILQKNAFDKIIFSKDSHFFDCRKILAYESINDIINNPEIYEIYFSGNKKFFFFHNLLSLNITYIKNFLCEDDNLNDEYYDNILIIYIFFKEILNKLNISITDEDEEIYINKLEKKLY